MSDHDRQQKAYDSTMAAQTAPARPSGMGAIGGLIGRGVPTPSMPTTLGRANEALNHLSTCELHAAQLRGILFGENSDNAELNRVEHTFDSLLSALCHRLASLAGELSTIKTKLGVPLE